MNIITRSDVKSFVDASYSLGSFNTHRPSLLKNNPYLKPESSQNLNAGIMWNLLSSKHRLLVEGNYLYRLASDLIRLDVVAITSQYQNLRSARVNSFEGNVKYQYMQRFQFELNTTYQT